MTFFKCDRCLKEIPSSEKDMVRVWDNVSDKNRKETIRVDLCKSCEDGLLIYLGKQP